MLTLSRLPLGTAASHQPLNSLVIAAFGFHPILPVSCLARVWQLGLPDPFIILGAFLPCSYLLFCFIGATEARIDPSLFAAVGLLTAPEIMASCSLCSSSPA